MIASIALVDLDFSTVRVRLQEEYGWCEDFSLAVEREYRLFLVDPSQRPTKLVDTFWHMHILDTIRYTADCIALYGEYLHHIPEGKKGRCRKGVIAA